MRRLKWLTPKTQVPFFIGLSSFATIALHLMYINFIKIQLIIAFAVVLIVITEFLCYQRREAPIKYAHFALGAFFVAVAQAFSIMDGMRIGWVCDPHNHWFQGHATWHVLAAIGLTIAYKHWEQFTFSEKPLDGQLAFDIDDIETQLEV